MDTNKIKVFAKQARIQLKEGVKNQLRYWGFDDKGQVVDAVEKTSGGYIFRGEVFDDKSVPGKWENLSRAIQRHTVDDIVEEAAYTWFNRLIAIKILEENGHDDPILRYKSKELEDPIILHNARKGLVQYVKETERKLVNSFLLAHDDEEAFGLLLICYCKDHRLLNRIFGSIDDYTELLLPNNLLVSGGIIDLLNNGMYISEDDFHQVELIGWLYQYYISDKKDEIFAGFKKNKKARPEDIPAATQIFTPKWIVKYMVENTVGRIWLDRHPESPIRDSMKYLVEPEDEEQRKSEPIISDVIELKLLDPACGSGHILVVGFDLLLKMYGEEGYTTRRAVESIIENNLFGLEIDKRAAQLANFSVLIKAAYYYPEILKKEIAPNIYSMPEPRDFSRQEIYDFLGEDELHFSDEMENVLNEMGTTKNAGSLIDLRLDSEFLDFLQKRKSYFDKKLLEGELNLYYQSLFFNLKPFLEPILIICDKYEAVVTNPPYMGRNNMNIGLKKFLEANYPISKYDLFSAFITKCISLNKKDGLIGMINLPSWMFLKSFEELRHFLLLSCSIESLIHLGRGIFGSDFGSLTFILRNKKPTEKLYGTYRQLFNQQGEVNSVSILEKRFLNREFKLFYKKQRDLLNIPGFPIAYWASDKVIKVFNKNPQLGNKFPPKSGLTTGNNDRFIKNWYEVNINSFLTPIPYGESNKWVPHSKGGGFRKWYGNNIHILNWENNGYFVKKNKNSVIRNENYYFKAGITWGDITISLPSFRWQENHNIPNARGPMIFHENKFLLGYLNSNVVQYFLKILNPTLTFNVGNISSIPIIEIEGNKLERIEELVGANIEISKNDWDSHELSWNFKRFPLLNKESNLYTSYHEWESKIKNDFFQLHADEEELTAIFNCLYGLDDEINPQISLSDITILQEELDIKELDKLEGKFRKLGKNALELPIKKDEVIRQLISYAVGCFMGRYRLDKAGLNIAHPNPSDEELSSYSYNGHHFEIDEDGIIPMMGSEGPFSDDIVNRIKNFVHIIWGEKVLTENLNFINEALRLDLEKFLTLQFWNYHKKMYKKKPIYWLFSSPNESFKVLVYMHRMGRFTVQKIRNNYMHKQLEYISREIDKLKGNEANLTKEQARRLDKLRADELECREYDLKLKEYADKQIEIDLDDGVSLNYEKFEGIVAKI